MRLIDSDEYDGRYDNETDGDELDTVPCPYCGYEIAEDADICPRCGSFIISEARTGKPMWVVWTALILLVLIFLGYTYIL